VDLPGRPGPGQLSGLDPGSPAGSLIATLLARCRFEPPGTAVVCGVSGGADSLALLALAVAAGLVPTAVHVDHRLRAESGSEAAVVAVAAAGLGAGFRAEQVDVAAGPNLEARARAARHRVLGDRALLGHTADDQAETVMLNLMRGAGVTGLAGIRADRRHPILGLRRHETEAVCTALGLVPVQDPSNQDPRHRRNRVRSEVLPLMADVSGRDVVAVIARQAAHLREVDALLTRLADGLDPTDGAALAKADPVVAAVAVRRWLASADAEGHPPDSATVGRVLAVARLEIRSTDVGGGRRVSRTGGRLRLES
jgi:tRNA(Ile)-lysidine synthase